MLDGALFVRGIYGAYKKLEQNKEEVNQLNVFPVPDGDTGTNMSLTMKSAVAQIQNLKDPTCKEVAKALGMGSLMGARGNSGVILSQLCRGVAEALKHNEKIDISDVSKIFTEAKEKAYKVLKR